MSESSQPTLLALSPQQLQVGSVARFTLRDEAGRVLLAKGLRIENQQALEALQARPMVYVDPREEVDATKAVMSGWAQASQQNVAIKDLDRFVLQATGPVGRRETAEGSPDEACQEFEARLRVVLGNVAQGAALRSGSVLERVQTLREDLQHWLGAKPDEMVLILMHRGVTGLQGYSAMHSLQCAMLSVLLAPLLQLAPDEALALTHAAMTMNVGMTALQDALALQRQPMSPVQRDQVDKHPLQSARLLQAAGVTDACWLQLVQHHHSALPPVAQRSGLQRLVHVLQVLDRYTAAMSPRIARPGRDAMSAARSAIVQAGVDERDEVGMALVQLLGMYPPGTFVVLETGETAFVLRKGSKATAPLVATVTNKRGEPVAEARFCNTGAPGMAVKAPVSASHIKNRVQMPTMLKLLAFSRTAAADRWTGWR